MDNYNKNHSDYEPNFVMRDPNPEEKSAGTCDGTGTYRDPRENFRKTSAGSEHSPHAAAAQTEYGTYGNTGEGYDGTFTARSGDSASWDNLNGLGKVRKRKKGKQPKPVSLTRRSLALIIVLCIVVSGAFGLGGAALGSKLFDDSSSQSGSGSVKTTGYNLADATGSNLTV